MKTKIPTFCETRFVERHVSLLAFQELFPAVIDTLQELVDEKREADAVGYLDYFLTAEAIFALFVAVKVTEPMLSLSRTLQASDNDLIAAFNHITSTKTMLETWLDNEDEFNILYVKMKEICEKYDSEVDFTRRGRRPELPFKEYMKQHYYNEYISAVIDGLDYRFGNRQQAAFSLELLYPSKFNELSYEEIENAVEQYADFLPDFNTVRTEIEMWKSYCLLLKKRPSTLKDTLSLFSSSTMSATYRNIKTLLVILATLPVTTGVVEKSFSTLRHIFSDFRASMTVERVSDLALLSWHNEMTHKLDTQEIIQVFNQKKRRANF